MKRKIASDINYEIIKTAESVPNTTAMMVSELKDSANAIKSWITNELQKNTNQEDFLDETPQVDVDIRYGTFPWIGGEAHIGIYKINISNEDKYEENEDGSLSEKPPETLDVVSKILDICEEKFGLMKANAVVGTSSNDRVRGASISWRTYTK